MIKYKVSHPMKLYTLMIRSYFLLPILFLAQSELQGQDMEQGFRQLEKGEFEKAKGFFEDILDQYPENKTGLICYGRAVGLSGDPIKALEIFNKLDGQYQNDIEVLLNKAEAYLWDKNPNDAIPIYATLIEQDSALFSAWLGSANSHSMAGNYEEAYKTIKKTLKIDAKNQQALLSRKYIVLGYANQTGMRERDFEKADQLINENLIINPEDQESLMLKGSLLMLDKQYDQSLKTFRLLKDQANSFMQQSLVLHLNGKNKEAFELASEALKLEIDSPKKAFAIKHHYLNSLLWNNSIKEAKVFYENLSDEFSDTPDVLFAGAQLAMYDADFQNGVALYNAGLGLDSASFAGNLGVADAYHAMKLERKAYRAAFITDKIFEAQPDVLAFIDKLNQEHSPKVSGKYILSASSDGSYNKLLGVGSELSVTPELKLGVIYETKEYLETGNSLRSSRKVLGLKGSQQINSSFKLNGGVQLMENVADESSNQSVNALFFNLDIDVRINKYLSLKTGYKSELLDFNRVLFLKQLKVDHLFLKSNFYSAQSGLGNYTELMKSYLNDGNQRFLLFTSLYRNIGKRKYLKAGLNYLNLAFTDSKPADYFSPTSHQQIEAFIGFNYKTKSQTAFQLESAYGYQWNSVADELTLRAKLSITQKYKSVTAELYGQYSTAANATFNGFSYQEYGIKLNVRLTDKPIFYKRIKKLYESGIQK